MFKKKKKKEIYLLLAVAVVEIRDVDGVETDPIGII
jgi:hypothetical protein